MTSNKNEKEVIIQEIKEIIAKITEIEINEINENISLHDDLDIDSLDIEEIIIEIEDKYNVIFEDEKIEEFDTIDDIVNNMLNNKKL